MPDARPITSDVDVDLGRLFGSLARNWLRILLAALVVTGLAFVLAGMVTPLYRAETRILIEMRESVYTRPASSGLGEGAAALPDAETIASQVEIIGSSDILREVARRLDLASHEEFGAAGETSMLGNLMILAGLKSDPTQASVEERVLEALRKGLSIFQVDGSRVIVVRFSSRDPELAASVANAVADAYVAGQEQAERMANADASEWLEPEIENLRGRVREAEARVAEYRAQSGLLIGQNNLALPTQELAEISTELTRARADRSAAEARAAAIRDAMASNGRVETMPEVLASPMVQRLRERQAQIEAEIADLSASLLENHPRMRALRAQGQETARQLRTEISKVLAATENEAATARGREERLVAEVNRLKAASAQAGDSEVELRALEREAMAQRALLESYLTRHREAAARADRSPAPADARIFARATAPAEAYFPKMVPILAAAFAGSLIVMSVLVLMRELFSGRAMRPAPGAVADEEDRPEDMQAVLVELEAEPEIGPEIEPVVVAMPAAAEDDDGAETELFASEIAGSDEEEDVTMARYQTEEVRPEEITVPEIAGELAGSDVGRAVFISPEGDEATAVSVTVARSLADAGLRTLFLDLTWSGAPSSAMLEE
ncbi:MAG TPA: GumC family protein, partial [Aquamicrobium sp.]|nr:GumC family protein [Aquamicrobium sp.]